MQKNKVKATARAASRPAPAKSPDSPGINVFWAGILIGLAGLIAYSNSFHGPFVFDDQASIGDNPTIQQGWTTALNPPGDGRTVTGRPLVNLSLWLNYQKGGLAVEGYHAVNLAIHLVAGLLLFGLVRRTLAGPVLREKYGGAALTVALAAALLWVLHPLQTEAVTYVVQRAEALMALFYLLTLYGFVRSMDSPQPRNWQIVAVASCLLGVFSKEVIVSAPLMVLLHDRTFVAGSFAEAWRRRWKFYSALAGTWLVLGWQVLRAGSREQSAGYSTGISSWEYARAQFYAVIHYLKLSVWPHPLVFDYGPTTADASAGNFAPYALLVAILVAGTAYALWRRPALGYAGFWFFAILAPTASVLPLAGQIMAEHHMYLPLAAVTVLAAMGLWNVLGRRALAAALVLAVALGALTFERNSVYHRTDSLWSDSASQRPEVARAHENVGIALFASGRQAESLPEYQTALKLDPTDAEIENNLGTAYGTLGQPDKAAPHLAIAAQRLPRQSDRALAYFNLGNALHEMNQWDAAIQAYQQAVQLNPDLAPANNNLGLSLLHQNRPAEAATAFTAALRVDPNFASARSGLDSALKQQQSLPAKSPGALP